MCLSASPLWRPVLRLLLPCRPFSAQVAQASPACLPRWHIHYVCAAMPRLPFCAILCVSYSCPEVSPLRFLSLSSPNLSTTVLPKAFRMVSLASQTWMTLGVLTAFEASKTNERASYCSIVTIMCNVQYDILDTIIWT